MSCIDNQAGFQVNEVYFADKNAIPSLKDVDSIKGINEDVIGESIISVDELITGLVLNQINIEIHYQFSTLLPSMDKDEVDQVMNACGKQIEKFKSLFKIFKNNEKYALRIALLIGNRNRLCAEHYKSELHEYLVDSSINDEARNESTPKLVKWLNEANESELDMLMKILEWKLFNVNIRHSYGYTFINSEGLDHFFENTSENLKTIFELLGTLTEKEQKSFLNVLDGLKQSGRVAPEKVIPLAYQLIQNGMISYSSIKKLQDLMIPEERIWTFKKEEIEQCLQHGTEFTGGDFDRYLTLVMKATTHVELEFFLSLDPDLCDFIMNIPSDQSSTIWENYVVRREGWNKYYNKEDQESQCKYGMMMHHSVKVASLCLEEKNWSYDELMHFIVMRRRHIAFFLDHPQRESTGVIKDAPCVTYCEGDYQLLADRLWEKYQSIKSGEESSPNFILDAPDLKSVPNMKYTAVLDGEPIELSSVEFRETYVPDAVVTRKNCTMVTHTSPENAEKIMKYVAQRLYPEAKAEKDPDVLVEKAGEIFWWICHAKPWLVGDPSKAEILFRTIWTVNGCKSPPWRKGIVPWIEAMSEPDVKVFAKKFASFFE